MQDEVEKLYIKEGKSRAIIKAIEDKLKPNHCSSMTYLSDPYGLYMHWNKTDGGHALSTSSRESRRVSALSLRTTW